MTTVAIQLESIVGMNLDQNHSVRGDPCEGGAATSDKLVSAVAHAMHEDQNPEALEPSKRGVDISEEQENESSRKRMRVWPDDVVRELLVDVPAPDEAH